METEKIKRFADLIRLETAKMLSKRGFGHLGGSFSIVETLAVLYGQVMKIDPKNPAWQDRDWFVLSKGHAGPALYATLALKGYVPLSMLDTLNENGTLMPSHPDRLKTPGVDVTTGSLGQGISLATGVAMSFKLDKKPNRVFAIVGDGEANEGQVWEAFQFATHQKLSNLLVFIDENHKQLDGLTKDIMNPFDLVMKMEAFGFACLRVKGNDVDAIYEAIRQLDSIDDQAKCIVLDTVKGQGDEYFENLFDNHHIRFSGDSKTALASLIQRLSEKVESEGRQ
jgi:transketolase